MLVIKVKDTNDLWNPRTREFLTVKGGTLKLEHSLISISKWEAAYNVSFLETKKTPRMFLDYIICMTLNSVQDNNIYNILSDEDLLKINDYINKPKTATTIKNVNRSRGVNNEIVTAEIIYYWMTIYGIPFECEKWHLDKLLTLIRVCSIKQSKPKKMSKADIYQQQRAINEANRAKYRTKG